MELQFQNKPLDCLRSVLCGVKSQEQTQEVKLPEAMPDVAKVLGAWGQCVLRGKEWHTGRMGASGGVMVWVLYAPEDGTFPRVVETWIPYQLQWELPQTQRDGTIVIQPLLKGVDARAVSARKLMVRACVEALGEAMEPIKIDTYLPEALPDDIYLLRKKYPVCIPVEAGEKTFTLEEELQLPQDCSAAGKLIHYALYPQIREQKLVGTRLLFRGTAILQGLCRDSDNSLRSFSMEIPFSQYAEPEKEWDDASVQVIPAVTNLELDLLDTGKILLKASMVGQYLICHRKLLEVVEDAYSPGAKVQLQVQPLQLPAMLEMISQSLEAEVSQELPVQDVIDAAFSIGQPEQHRNDSGMQVQLFGSFQVLYRDQEATLQSASVKWEHSQQIPMDSSAKLCGAVLPVGSPVCAQTGNGIHLQNEAAMTQKVFSTEEIPMVVGLAITPENSNSERPSLILRRPGDHTLWEIAKEYGSTETAIRQANGLSEEPAPDRILLIPVV